jgi:2-polyprenyl-3-methyl-5-hydroxy-6-metoxy-1,4-benzoquinol methylase
VTTREPLCNSRKPDDYYGTERTDFLGWVGGVYHSVLDVGCGSGANADWYRTHGAQRVVGIEIDETAAREAAARLDIVLHETVEQAIGQLHERFDLIVCGDVLEHLVDPWGVVASLRALADSSTILAVSVPNIRFLPALTRIAIGRGFVYEERGIFDSTHLRFFTRADVSRMLQSAGWEPRRWGGPPFRRLRFTRRLLGIASRGMTDEWLAGQIYVVADLGSNASSRA